MLEVGIIGLGTIGKVVAKALDEGIMGLRLQAVASGREDRARSHLSSLKSPVEVMSIDELAACCDILVDCAPKTIFGEIADAAIAHGRILVTVSGAGILANPGIETRAEENNARIILATGALLGLDAVRAAAEGTIHSVKMVTRKPPNALEGAPHIVENNINLEGLNGATRVFKGSAREGAAAFPANVNVAAALGLAGIGADLTQLEVWADPHLDRNTHSIEVDADSASFSFSIQNVQSPENPGTGKITALSVIACLRGLTQPMKIGS